MQLFHPKGYRIACDSCGKTFSVGGRSIFLSAYAAVEAAKEQGWKTSKSRVAGDVSPECRKFKVHTKGRL